MFRSLYIIIQDVILLKLASFQLLKTLNVLTQLTLLQSTTCLSASLAMQKNSVYWKLLIWLFSI